MQTIEKTSKNKLKILLAALALIAALAVIYFDFDNHSAKAQRPNNPDNAVKTIHKIPEKTDKDIAQSNMNEVGSSQEEEQARHKPAPVSSSFITNGEIVRAIVSNDAAHDFEEREELPQSSEAEVYRVIQNEDVPLNAKRSKIYLGQISAVSNMMVKFLQKSDYTAELESIDQKELPPEVKNVLDDMQKFAAKDTKISEVNKVIFPKEGVVDRIVGHFIQIEQIPSSRKAKDERYEQICKKLYIIESYFYSQKFLDETMDHD